ncbi:hypothetical protein [Shewanella salipaludis]|uniref:Entry exclusion lipoprotein TrbK n=1 Tax=Shewanella salipaludis TaxID=2723052 RepID=A0A972FQS2_9GAMM|nr:hypothetical protein [Shewanella salipaludis]NMH64420.1 hypothetical protein [Shewanella salipaludis]
MRKLLVFTFIALIVGCSSKSAVDTAAMEKEHDLVCEYVAKTGSNMKRRTCMTRVLAEELRKESKEDLREAWQRGQTQTSTQ